MRHGANTSLTVPTIADTRRTARFVGFLHGKFSGRGNAGFVRCAELRSDREVLASEECLILQLVHSPYFNKYTLNIIQDYLPSGERKYRKNLKKDLKIPLLKHNAAWSSHSSI